MEFLPKDFKSFVSADFTTAAKLCPVALLKIIAAKTVPSKEQKQSTQNMIHRFADFVNDFGKKCFFLL